MVATNTNETPIAPKQPDRSLADLVAEMSKDLSTLMHKEIELAREEIREEVTKAGKAGAPLGAGAACAVLMGVALVMTLGFALDAFMPAWVAFLIVTAAFGIGAYVLAMKGKRDLKTIQPMPEQTVETLKEDAQWLSELRS